MLFFLQLFYRYILLDRFQFERCSVDVATTDKDVFSSFEVKVAMEYICG